MGKVVKNGDKITVDYVGKFTDGKVFDTSIESVAKEAGKYMEGRNYGSGLSFEVGAGQMIKGFDKGVVGMKVGETKTVEIPAIEAYGERRDDLVFEVEKSKLPAGEYKEGMMLSDQMGNAFKVAKVTDDKITLDANHDMAGKDLVFDITVLSIDSEDNDDK
ncbi:MAG: peptidylprolyl isomerase [candidate division SR1 bacterium]|nr:MAG: peptidylprolyl isomerase [candidate division SR1 bacterium]